jgi:hypothetical protein
MTPRQISRLRRIILSEDYLVDRWKLMWRESDMWYDDWRCFKRRWMLKVSIMYRKKAEWYSRKMDDED